MVPIVSRGLTVAVAAVSVALTAFLSPVLTPAASAGDGDYLNVRLSNTDDGRILVRWDPASGSAVTKYVVDSSTNRTLDNDVESVQVSRDDDQLVIDPAVAVTPESGDYTFVKVRVFRSTGINGASPAKWIMPTPVTPPATGPKVKMSTFNVRSWSEKATNDPSLEWKKRRPHVIDGILDRKPGILVVQEAGGAPKVGVAGDLWQYQDLVRRLPDRYKLAEKLPYVDSKGDSYGKQGTRIIYNSNLYRRLDRGVMTEPYFEKRNMRWVPWALFRAKASGVEFYVFSAHFEPGDDSPGSTKYYDIRQKQVDRVVDLATDFASTTRSVLIGGDFNSTNNTTPNNNVHRTLLTAGFYDAFATTNITNEQYPTTSGFRFPVEPAPNRRDYLMVLHKPLLPLVTPPPLGSYKFINDAKITSADLASDHFMQTAVLPLMAGPYPPAL